MPDPDRGPGPMSSGVLLVSYPLGRFSPARREIVRVLERLGDPAPAVERSPVPGVAVVSTALDPRDVIRRCQALFAAEGGFELAVKWVPVDLWCETDLEAIRRAIETHVRDRIGADETWAMVVEKRRWQAYQTAEIVQSLAAAVDRRVDLRRPDWIVRIDVLGPRTAVSLLRPGETFSSRATARGAPS